MREKLAARISERLDLQPEQSERVLRTLAQLIKRQGERDGRVRVPGLGVFRQRADTLTFEPDPVLSDAVNGRYAGLEPIRVPPPPPAGDTEPAPEAAPAEATPVEAAAAVDEETPAGGEEAVVDGQAPAHAEEAPFEEEAAFYAEESAGPEQDLSREEAPGEEEALAEEEGFAEEQMSVSEDAAPDEAVREDIPAETPAPAAASADAYPDEGDYDNPDVSEAAAYKALRASPPERRRAFEETDPSPWAPPWAPPGARRTGAGLDEPPPVPAAEAAPDDVPSAASLSRPPEARPVWEEAPATAARAAGDARRRDRPPPSTRAQKPPAGAKRRAFLPWILLVVFLVVAAAGAYYLLAPRPQTAAVDRQEAGVEAPQDSPPEADATGSEGDAPVEEEAGAAETPPEQETPAPEPVAEAPPAQVDAARPIDRAAGGFTLVVASRAQQDQAEAAVALFRQRLSAQAIPVDVLRGVSNGVTRYRVGVGQVPTAEEALVLKDQLGDAIPPDAWITRIVPDN